MGRLNCVRASEVLPSGKRARRRRPVNLANGKRGGTTHLSNYVVHRFQIVRLTVGSWLALSRPVHKVRSDEKYLPRPRIVLSDRIEAKQRLQSRSVQKKFGPDMINRPR